MSETRLEPDRIYLSPQCRADVHCPRQYSEDELETCPECGAPSATYLHATPAREAAPHLKTPILAIKALAEEQAARGVYGGYSIVRECERILRMLETGEVS
jgi:hypothetical protein